MEVKLQEGRRERHGRRDDARRHEAEVAACRIGDVDAEKLQDDAQPPGGEDADEDVSLDVLYDEHGGQEDAEEREEDGDSLGVERSFCHRLGKREERDELRTCDDDMRVLQADECDEKADADGDGALQGQRNRIEESFAHIRHGKCDEDQTLDENRRQCELPRVAHLPDDRVGEEGVESHRGRQRERQIGKRRHEDARDARSERRRREYRARIHARSAQDQRVHGEDVRHRHECRKPRQKLRLHRRAVFLQVKHVFQHFFHRIVSFSLGRFDE